MSKKFPREPGTEGDPYDNLPSSEVPEAMSLSLAQPFPGASQPPPYSLTDEATGVTMPPAPPATSSQAPDSLSADSHASFVVSLESPPSGPPPAAGVHGNISDVHITAMNTRSPQDKSLLTAYCLGAPLGFLGAHHFYLGRPRFGVLYLCTMGLFGLGWLTDICRMPLLVQRTNIRRKDPATYFMGPEDRDLFYTYIMWLTLGFIGTHHYYLRRWKWAVLYTFTVGLFGIGWMVDAFRLPSLTRDTNRKLAEARSQSVARGPQLKKLTSAYLLWIPPVGLLGGHHYYMGRTRFGVLYTLTGGLFFMGWLADCIRMSWLVDRINDQLQENFKKAADGKLITRDRTRYVDDAYVLHCSPLGLLGAAHFYLGRYRWAVLYLFTFGLFGVGWIYDMFRMRCHVKAANERRKGGDRIQIQYGPNTQVIVVTDGRVVSGGQPGAGTPVVIPTVGVTGTQSQHVHADQPPSYDSVVTDAQNYQSQDLEATDQMASEGPSACGTTAQAATGTDNPVFKHSLSQEDADPLPRKQYSSELSRKY